MAAFRRLVTLVTVLFCLGEVCVSADESLDELNERLSSLELRQDTWRQALESLGQRHQQDVVVIRDFCDDMKSSVDEQQAVLEELQQSVLGQGPCHPDNYTVIDDPRRAVEGPYHGHDEICDRDIDPGWKRFKLNDENAVVPTTCVPENYCQTDAPTWVDLQGQSLPGVGQQVEARACSHWVDDCCNWEAPVTVHNCGDFFVYKVQSLRVCHLAFCAEPQN